MFWCIVIIVIILIAFGVNFENKQKEKKNQNRGIELKQKLQGLDNFAATKEIIGIDNTYILAIDQNKKIIAFIKENTKQIIPFNQLLSVEVIEDNTILSQKSSLRTLGGAFVGGAIAGGAGVIVGGLSGDSKQSKKVSKVQVKIKLRDINNPSFTIDCFDCKTMTISERPVKPTSMVDGDVYKQGLNDAQQIADTLSVIIDDVDRAEKKSHNTSTTNKTLTNSIVNELAQLVELKEKGILTEDEFNTQKKILLNNSHT